MYDKQTKEFYFYDVFDVGEILKTKFSLFAIHTFTNICISFVKLNI